MTDTIVAQATPPGRGGVGIVRVSGPDVTSLFPALLRKASMRPRQASFTPFYSKQGEVIDEGVALFFQGPHSYTGEDTLELHTHGSTVVIDWLIDEILQLGCRMARPGEFTERAFLNDKLDLAQAEAVADLIDAHSKQAARCALQSLQGVFSNEINALVDKLTHLRMYVEAAIDFPEEEIDFLSDGVVQSQLSEIISAFHSILAQAKQGQLLREGMTLVIAGRPNAGKSSLLNALSGQESAIVTEIAGTTRDIVKEHIQLEGVPLHLVDTAGLRETEDLVEREGVKRARTALKGADRILLVVDGRELDEVVKIQQEALFGLPEGIPVTLVVNKADLTSLSPGEVKVEAIPYPAFALSAKFGEGLDAFKRHLLTSMGVDQNVEGKFIARRRHLTALQQAFDYVTKGAEQLAQHQAGELLAEDLRLAQQHLGEITGQFTADDLLGKIFSSFCIGK